MDLLKRLLEHRYLPAAFAIGAMLVMLPALKTGLVLDDLVQRIAFRFNTSLDSPDFHWLWFDWRTSSAKPFKVPAIGQSVTWAGPSRPRTH